MPRPLPFDDSLAQSAAHSRAEDLDRSSFGGLADVLEPDVSRRAAPVSIREPAQVQDFAFADTVSAGELADSAPPSHPFGVPSTGHIFFDDAASNTLCVTPLAFPLPGAGENVGLATRLRVAAAHARHGARRSLEETRDLWRDAGEIVASEIAEGVRLPPSSPFRAFARRVVALWSCFQWTRADLARAGIIALAVFIVMGVAFTSLADRAAGSERDRADNDGAASAARGDEVRVARTLDQHTGRTIALRNKR